MKTRSLILSITLVGLILFVPSCKKDEDETVAPKYTGTVSNGGISFDKFWSEESPFDQNSANLTTLNDFSNFFRCKQCHGWDGLGSNGAYIGRGPKSDRPNVSDFNLYEMGQTESAQELFDELKETDGRRDISYDLSTYDPVTNFAEGDKMPNLTQLMSDAQLWDLVKFMKEGMFDVSNLYDATYTGVYPTGSKSFTNIGKDGNASNGLVYYNTNCATCHGDDGTKLDLEGRTAGKFIREKGNEAQHKIKYGQLGSSMTGDFDMSLAEMKDLYKACADTVVFPN